jgi:predicted PurR-regulated permease PerM
VSLLAVAALLAVLSWQVAEPFWPFIALGLLVAALTHPWYRRLARRLGRPRVAAGLTVTLSAALLILPLAVVAWRVVGDLAGLVGDITVAGAVEQVRTVMVWSQSTFGYPTRVDEAAARDLLEEVVPSVRGRLAAWVPRAISSTAGVLLGLLVTLAVAYYSLLNGDGFVERLQRASPLDDGVETELLEEARNTMHGVV